MLLKNPSTNAPLPPYGPPLPQEIVDRLGRTWRIDFRVQECSDRHLVCLERVDKIGEWWIHVFPCWESRDAQRMLYETGVEIADGMPARAFATLANNGRAVAMD